MYKVIIFCRYCLVPQMDKKGGGTFFCLIGGVGIVLPPSPMSAMAYDACVYIWPATVYYSGMPSIKHTALAPLPPWNIR